jgi:hypothetical protein
MQTITERYGRKRLTIFFVCCFAIIGAFGVVRTMTTDDGPPSCAMVYAHTSADDVVGGEEMNKAVDCGEAVDKWCAENHPENPDDCVHNIDIDGDDRNVGKG